jgi:hypothetical protein
MGAMPLHQEGFKRIDQPETKQTPKNRKVRSETAAEPPGFLHRSINNQGY